MKKFSNITGQKVGQENKPVKLEAKVNEEDQFKMKVYNLLDDFLSIRTYGPISRYFNASSIKITGKELFLEALMDLLKEKTTKQETKILESLKSSVKDWKAIDEKIEEANKSLDLIKERQSLSNYRMKINSLLSSYQQDEDFLLQMVDESCRKITTVETAISNSEATLTFLNEGKFDNILLKKISEKFKDRAKQLGY